MRRPPPHQKLPARAVAVGVVAALTLAACGSGEGDAVAGLETAGDQSSAATVTSLGSTIPEAAPIVDGGGQGAADDAALPAPGLPVASDRSGATPTAPPTESATGDSATAGGNTGSSATTPGSVTTLPPSSETTAATVTQPPSTAAPTTQAPTTSPPVAANLPNLAVVDIPSGASVGFPQAAQAGGLPVLLWFWSPT